MFSAFGEHSLEAELGSLQSDVVAVYERGVAEHGRFLSEIVDHLLALFAHIGSEALTILER